MPATDYTRTNNPRSLHLADMAIPFPEWVQGTAIPTHTEFEKLASVAFADPKARRLPVSTKEATFFSAVDYFANVGNYPTSVFDCIKTASEWFGISKDIAPYAELFAERIEKSASEVVKTPGKFAISTYLAEQEFRILPINDPHQVTKAASDLLKMVDENRIHYLMFVDAAREVVKAASEVGSDQPLPHAIERVGAERFPDFEKAARMLESRRSVAARHEGAFESYLGAIRAAETGGITADECMQKIAAIDDALGIRQNLGLAAKIPAPHLVVFSGPSHAAVEKAAKTTAVIRGVALPLTAIDGIPAIQLEFKLSKAANADVINLLAERDARPLSMAIDKWDITDQKELLRLAVAHSPA